MNERIIVMYDEYDKELNMSLYDYIDDHYRYSKPVLVCHVTEEEYQKMLVQIEQLSCLKERLSKRKDKLEYDSERYLIMYDTYGHNLSILNYDNPNQKRCFFVNEDGMNLNQSNQILSSFMKGKKIYTTETYDDVVKHYTRFPIGRKITVSKIEKSRLKKAYERIITKDLKDYTTEEYLELKFILAKMLKKCEE